LNHSRTLFDRLRFLTTMFAFLVDERTRHSWRITALTQLTASLQVLSGHAERIARLGAFFRPPSKNASHVQASAELLVRAAPTGYILVTSSPDILFEIVDAGTRCHRRGSECRSARQSTGLSAGRYTPRPRTSLPCSAISEFHQLVDRLEIVRLPWAAYQSPICRDIMARFRLRFGRDRHIELVAPGWLMKSIFRSTFSLSAHSRHSLASGSLAPGHPMIPKSRRIACRPHGRRERTAPQSPSSPLLRSSAGWRRVRGRHFLPPSRLLVRGRQA